MSRTLRFRAILGPRGVERDRSIEIDAEGRIAAIGPASGPYDGFLALPGLPNAHSHAFQRALSGFGEAARGSDSFWTWRDAMYRLAGALDPDGLFHIARLAFLEMLRAGFTSVVEFHYLHHGREGERGPEMADAVSRAASEAGIPLVLLPVYYRRADFESSEPDSGQIRFAHGSVEEFLGLVERLPAAAGVAPHSLRAVPPGELEELVSGADRLIGPGCPLHIHVSEQEREVERCRAAHGRTPIELLAEHVELGPRWGLVHATHATADERKLVRAAGATVVLCPLTEAYLGDGLFEASEHFEAGGGAAIGSDSNVRIDAIEEVRMLEYGQRLRDRRRARLATGDGLAVPVWSRLAAAGARASGLAAGAIEPGRRADLVVLDEESRALAGHEPETALDAWLVGGDASAIAAVWVAGERRVDHGSAAGLEEARAAFAETVRRVMTNG